VNRVVDLLPTVFPDDVFDGVEQVTVERLVASLQRVNLCRLGTEEDRTTVLVRALSKLPYGPGSRAGHANLGLDPEWTSVISRLHDRDDPGFCRLAEPRAKTFAEASAGASPFVSDNTVDVEDAYTLRLTFELPQQRHRPVIRQPTSREPVRPYRTGGDADADVEALADHLRPQVLSTFGGKSRLELDPVLVPICAAAATVWVALKNYDFTWTNHQPRRIRADALLVAVAEVAGDNHGRTLARILTRNREDHIPIYVGHLPERIAPKEWGGWLGRYVLLDDGTARLVGEHDRATLPRVLTCLAGPDPV
jgi:hypothetical protein